MGLPKKSKKKKWQKKKKKWQKFGTFKNCHCQPRYLDKISIFVKNFMCITQQKPKKNWQNEKKKTGKNLASTKKMQKKKVGELQKKKKVGEKLGTLNFAKKKIGQTEKKKVGEKFGYQIPPTSQLSYSRTTLKKSSSYESGEVGGIC